VAVLVLVYASLETVLFWLVARRAAEVQPLRRRVHELESSSDELARLGGEVTRLKSFEQQLRKALSSRESGNLESLPWDERSPAALPTGDQLNPPKPNASPVGEARGVGMLSYTAMDLPTATPVRGFVTRPFIASGSPQRISHYGLDIAAREGTPVLAAADGLVLFADWTYRYGNLVVITHRSGYTSFYGHNQVLFVRTGERVRQGQPIALLGNSGVSTAPHLHFEIWRDGSPVDPATLLRASP
jgi:murein DD-endopeptidase MepM/ murein hydrolase activator NlpD